MNIHHHANLLIGNAETCDQLISILEKEFKIAAQGNPDFIIRNYDTFTIDDVREIKVLHSTRPLGGSDKNGDNNKKIFVLTMNGATIEAQNAMLKILEEPADYAHFFLVIPSAHLLLPTVRSRMLIIKDLPIPSASKLPHSLKEIDAELLDQAQVFLKANQAKRLDIVKKLIDDIAKELPVGKPGRKTKQDAINFINAIQKIVYENSKSKAEFIKNKKSFDAIELVRNYLNDRAPSVKMLLEYMALNV